MKKNGGGLAAVLLAAGASHRFGGCKLAEPVDGAAMLQRVLGELAASVGERIVVVLGEHAQLLEPLVDHGFATRCPDAGEGMGRSLAWGAQKAVQRFAPDALLVALADQVALDTEDFSRLLDASASGSTLAVSRYRATGAQNRDGQDREVLGVPAVFPGKYFAALQALQGDAGARKIIAARRSEAQLVDMPRACIDIDTVEDLQAFNLALESGPARN